LVFYSTLGVLRSSISVLLEEVPPNIDWDDIYTTITKVEGVSNQRVGNLAKSLDLDNTKIHLTWTSI
jgi:Co/Zn/Cd efflux system component